MGVESSAKSSGGSAAASAPPVGAISKGPLAHSEHHHHHHATTSGLKGAGSTFGGVRPNNSNNNGSGNSGNGLSSSSSSLRRPLLSNVPAAASKNLASVPSSLPQVANPAQKSTSGVSATSSGAPSRTTIGPTGGSMGHGVPSLPLHGIGSGVAVTAGTTCDGPPHDVSSSLLARASGQDAGRGTGKAVGAANSGLHAGNVGSRGGFETASRVGSASGTSAGQYQQVSMQTGLLPARYVAPRHPMIDTTSMGPHEGGAAGPRSDACFASGGNSGLAPASSGPSDLKISKLQVWSDNTSVQGQRPSGTADLFRPGSTQGTSYNPATCGEFVSGSSVAADASSCGGSEAVYSGIVSLRQSGNMSSATAAPSASGPAQHSSSSAAPFRPTVEPATAAVRNSEQFLSRVGPTPQRTAMVARGPLLGERPPPGTLGPMSAGSSCAQPIGPPGVPSRPYAHRLISSPAAGGHRLMMQSSPAAGIAGSSQLAPRAQMATRFSRPQNASPHFGMMRQQESLGTFSRPPAGGSLFSSLPRSQ
jgi:hypothetical protein